MANINILSSNEPNKDPSSQMDTEDTPYNVENNNEMDNIRKMSQIHSNKGSSDNYIYDFNTSNKTFIGVHNVLKKMGIKNNKFFLLLYDKDLVGVDPRDPTLSIDMENKIVREVKRNFWYYIREVILLRTEAGKSKFMLHIGNLSSMYLKLLNLNYYLEQPRQTGKTLGEMSAESYYFGFGCLNTDFGFYNYQDRRAKENLQTMIDTLQLLPEYLKIFNLEEITDDDGNKAFQERRKAGKKIKSFDNPILGNKVVTQTAGQTESKAITVGRGATQAKINMDEIGHYRFNWKVWGSASYAHTTAANNAQSANKPYGVSWTSTPPLMNSEAGEWLYKFVKEKSAKFEVFMFDYTREELVKYLKKNAKKDFFYVTYQYYELGYTEDWAATQMRQSSTKEDFKRDILLQWIKDLTSNPYSEIALNKIESIVKKVNYESYVIDKKYHFKIFPSFEMAKFKNIVVGVDVGQGMGGNYDYSTMVGVDPETTEVVFTMRTNEADTKVFSKLICKFIQDKLSNCLIVIERNSIGKAIVDNIKGTKYEKYLYFSPFSDRHEIEGAIPEITTTQGTKCYYGIINVSKIRDRLFEILGTRIKKYKKLFNCTGIHQEITNLVDTGRRIQHRSGTYDDLLIAYLFALYVLLRDDMLLERFGIPTPNPPTDDDEEIDNNLDEFVEEETFESDMLLEHFHGETMGIKTSDDVIDEIESQDFSKRLREDEDNEKDNYLNGMEDDLFRF